MSPYVLHGRHARATRLDRKVGGVYASVDAARARALAVWEVAVEAWVTLVWVARGTVALIKVSLLTQVILALVAAAFLVPMLFGLALLAMAAHDARPPLTPAQRDRINDVHCVTPRCFPSPPPVGAAP